MLYFRTYDNKIVSSKRISEAHKLISGCSVHSDVAIRQIVPYMKGVVSEVMSSKFTESVENSCLCDKSSSTWVAGFSDDTVEICRCGEYKSFDCWESGVKIYFDDGTVIDVKYEKPGIWRITIKKHGTAPYMLYTCNVEDPETDYVDIFYIDATVVKTRKIR